MGSRSAIQSRFLPHDSVSLATFVTDVNYPLRSFHRPFTSEEIDHTNVVQKNVYEVDSCDHNTSVGGQLTKLFNLQKGKSEEQSTALSAASSTAYELCQWMGNFSKACSQKSTRRWMEYAIEEGQSVYFIVGYRTLSNPKTMEIGLTHKDLCARAELQLSPSIAYPNLPINMETAFDPAISRSSKNTAQSARTSDIEGEIIYALQYCEVTFKWHSSKRIEKSTLGPTRWKIRWGVRSAEELEEDDVIEAILDMSLAET